jgi:hypothetical protein
MLFQVALVVLLGPVERRRRGDLRDDLPPARLLLGIARCDRGFQLASVIVEDRRAVLAAEIGTLAVAGGRIVDPSEHLKQIRAVSATAGIQAGDCWLLMCVALGQVR